jgi:hypothetical protein
MYVQEVQLQAPTPDWPQHDHPATSVIAQQYSFTTFVSLHLYSCTEKFGAHLKNVVHFLF